MPDVDGLFFVRLNDPHTVENAVGLTGATAGLTLIDPRRLSVGGRIAYRAALGAITGWATWTAVRTEHEYLMPTAAKIGVTAGAVGVVLALCEASEALDARIHDALASSGVRRPRLAMAGATAALGVGSWWLARRVDNEFPDFEPDDDPATPETVPVPEEVRALVSAILEKTESFGARELRAQLAQAGAIAYMGEREDEFYPGIGFEVPEKLPHAVPANATFPVIGRYRPLDGRTFDVRLFVSEGRLASLDVFHSAEWSEDEIFEWEMSGRSVQDLPGWPSPDELAFLIETPEGLAALA